jgi:hypothetical protein
MYPPRPDLALSRKRLPQNRWLLVEFIFPSSQPVPAALALSPQAGAASSSSSNSNAAAAGCSSVGPQGKGKGKRKAPPGRISKRRRRDATGVADAEGEIVSSDEDDSEASDEDDPKPFLHPSHPLLLPPPPAGSGQPRVLGEKAIHAALKASVLQAFGDDGWAKVASNTNGAVPYICRLVGLSPPTDMRLLPARTAVSQVLL